MGKNHKTINKPMLTNFKARCLPDKGEASGRFAPTRNMESNNGLKSCVNRCELESKQAGMLAANIRAFTELESVEYQRYATNQSSKTESVPTVTFNPVPLKICPKIP